MVVVAGEITTKAKIDYAEVVRDTVRRIGYTSSDMGFDADTCAVLAAIDRQSPDISQGVTEGEGLHKEQGAGDQGLMFGFACDETPELMPLPIVLAHQLVERLAAERRTGKYPFLRPDSKSQVTVQYRDGKPVRVDAVVVSTQHSPDVAYETLREMIINEVIKQGRPRAVPRRAHRLPRQPDRPLRRRRADGRLRAHRPQDHRRHLRRLSAATAAAPSPARIRARSTAAPRTWRATSPRTSSPPGWRASARCSWRTRSASPQPLSVLSTPSTPARCPTSCSASWCASTSR